jgi:hypothetical protein
MVTQFFTVCGSVCMSPTDLVSSEIGRTWRSTLKYLVDEIRTLQGLVSRPICVREKVSVNQKLHSYQEKKNT